MNALKLDDAVRANWQMFDSAKDCYDKVYPKFYLKTGLM